MTTTDEVLTFLNKMTKNRVKTETAELMLSLAKTEVSAEKSASASNDIIDSATLTRAAYLSYLAYATEQERSVGEVPAPLLTHLMELKLLAEQHMNYARRGSTARIPVIATTTSIDTTTGFE